MTQNETSVANRRPAGKTVPSSGNRTRRKIVSGAGLKPREYINKDQRFMLESQDRKKREFMLSADDVPGTPEGSPKPKPGIINPGTADTSQVPSTTPTPEPTAPSSN